jgi:hypothetical protein
MLRSLERYGMHTSRDEPAGASLYGMFVVKR